MPDVACRVWKKENSQPKVIRKKRDHNQGEQQYGYPYRRQHDEFDKDIVVAGFAAVSECQTLPTLELMQFAG